jgi:hypothetical protein
MAIMGKRENVRKLFSFHIRRGRKKKEEIKNSNDDFFSRNEIPFLSMLTMNENNDRREPFERFNKNDFFRFSYFQKKEHSNNSLLALSRAHHLNLYKKFYEKKGERLFSGPKI